MLTQWIFCTLGFLISFLLLVTASSLEEGDLCELSAFNGICLPGSKCDTLEEAINLKILTKKTIAHCGLNVFEELICCPVLPTTRKDAASTQKGNASGYGKTVQAPNGLGTSIISAESEHKTLYSSSEDSHKLDDVYYQSTTPAGSTYYVDKAGAGGGSVKKEVETHTNVNVETDTGSVASLGIDSKQLLALLKQGFKVEDLIRMFPDYKNIIIEENITIYLQKH